MSCSIWLALEQFDILTLIYDMEVDLDLNYSDIEGQGRRSKVKVKC